MDASPEHAPRSLGRPAPGAGVGDEASAAPALDLARSAVADVERRAVGEREHLAPCGGRRPAPLGQPPHARAGRARAAARAGARAPAGRGPASTVSTTTSSTSASSRSSSAVRSTLASAAGCSARSAGISPWRARLRANAGDALRRVLAPREAARRAPRRGLRAPGAEQRAHEPALARAHAEQRAPARRGGEPVEHRLDLVGRGVAGGHVGVAPPGEPRRLGVADVARPGLEVALGPARHGRPRAGRRAARTARAQWLGVGRRGVAQAVVDVQRAHVAGDPHREVEQADRVAPAGEQHDDRAPGPQQALRRGPRPRGSRRPPPASARNSSVASVKPLSRTSPMRSNSRWSPAASTTGRVTSTSPPAARAATREARLTSRP